MKEPSLSNLLLRLSVEYLPASVQRDIDSLFAKRCSRILAKAGWAHQFIEVEVSATKIAIKVMGVYTELPGHSETIYGPLLTDEDTLSSPIVQQWAAQQAIPLATIALMTTGSHTRAVAERKGQTRHLALELRQLLPELLSALPANKRLSWNAKETTANFSRPIRAIEVELKEKPLEGTSWGLIWGAPSPLPPSPPASSWKARRKRIMDLLAETSAAHGWHLALSDTLLDELTAIIEEPTHVGLVPFSPHYLALPRKAVLHSLENDQRLVPVMTASGELLPYGLTLLTCDTLEMQRWQADNRLVLESRLADLSFFYTLDRQISHQEWLKRLKQVEVHEKLGTLYDKVVRLGVLTSLEWHDPELKLPLLNESVRFAKLDATSRLVFEKPECEGAIAACLAVELGASKEVAAIVSEHRLPVSAGDPLPLSREASWLSLVDKADDLVGLMGVGESATATHDPFGLRRLVRSILRLELHNKVAVSFPSLVQAIRSLYPPQSLIEGCEANILAFYTQRLIQFLREEALFTADEIKAVLGGTHPLSTLQRYYFGLTLKSQRNQETTLCLKRAATRLNHFLAAERNNPAEKPQQAACLFNEVETVKIGQLRETLMALAPIPESPLPFASLSACEQRLQASLPLANRVHDIFDTVYIKGLPEEAQQTFIALLTRCHDKLNEVIGWHALAKEAPRH